MPKIKYTPELGKKICESIMDGKSVKYAAESNGLTERVIYKWANGFGSDEGFVHDYIRAQEIRADRMAEELLDIADDSANDFIVDDDGNMKVDHEAIHRARLRIDTRKFLMSKMKSFKYGDKTTTVLQGDKHNPITIEEKSDSEKEARILELLGKAGIAGAVGVEAEKAGDD